MIQNNTKQPLQQYISAYLRGVLGQNICTQHHTKKIKMQHVYIDIHTWRIGTVCNIYAQYNTKQA